MSKIIDIIKGLAQMVDRIRLSTQRGDSFILACTILNKETGVPVNYAVSNMFAKTREDGELSLKELENLLDQVVVYAKEQNRISLASILKGKPKKEGKFIMIDKLEDGSISINFNK